MTCPTAGRSSNFYPRPPYGGRPTCASCAPWPQRYFYPRPPYGGRPAKSSAAGGRWYFYPRPPYGGRRGPAGYPLPRRISIHVPRMGDDRRSPISWSDRPSMRFLSTSPVWGTTAVQHNALQDAQAQISIHVPRMGDDAGFRAAFTAGRIFLSTSPVWGTTRRAGRQPPDRCGFLSTSPVWGTTSTGTCHTHS